MPLYRFQIYVLSVVLSEQTINKNNVIIITELIIHLIKT